MKKAFSYLRISTKDQSNFSIEAQKEANEKYAKENEAIILESFVDDGVSAKNFDRPSWKDLYKQLKKLRKELDYLLVAKYDRLVRNAADGLAMLRKIEEEYGIKVISTTECFFIDPHSPVFFKFRADLFVNAEFEYRVIRDRTKMGNWQAKMSGRYITTAPLGYDNARDDRNKPIIVQNEYAWKVKKAFKMYLEGSSFMEIKQSCKINRKGKSAIKRILQNCTYAGLIYVKPYRDYPEKYVNGLHQPIVSKEVYWSVQEKLGGRYKKKPTASDKAP